jgi:hypothetical protein
MTSSRLAAVWLALGLAVAPRARADDPYPTRSGETGFVEVPSAGVVGRGGSLLGAEFRLDHASGEPTRVGPFPIYAVAGLGERLETGFSFRQWGRPGDEFPQRTALGAAAKLKLAHESHSNPALAVDVTGDRLNASPVLGARLIASGVPGLPIRYAAFAGGEMGPHGGKSGAVVGGALGFGLPGTSEAILEALWGPRGADFGAAARWRVRPTTSVQVGLNYLPDGNGFRLSVGFGFTPRRQARPEPAEERPPAAEAPQAMETPPTGEHREDRPHFRLRVPTAAGAAAQARHLQYGPDLALAAAPDRQAPAPGTRPVAPTLDQLAEAQLREQEAAADTRDRRVRGTGEQIEAREKSAQAEAAKLEERERELAAREQQLDVREKQVAAKGSPGPQQRQLESLEAQLASQERTLSAQERSFGPAVDAAQGREREAAAREDAERQEANRLAASVNGASSRALQLEIRKQSLGARNRQLAALEARLVARGERIDALERQLRAKAERLDSWSRRLDARADRLDLAERRTTESQRPPAAGTTAEAGAKASKDKASFVMIVKSPTAIVKELAAAPAAGAAAAALHPGVAVEKAVAAATIVSFAAPASKLSELDAEALDNLARLAAKERCELLIWARAKDPGLMAEAQRRAGEIRTRVLAAGKVDEQQIVTRITTRPGAQGVDVVVSALRESTKAAPAGAAAPPAAASLLSGESGKRQVREAVQAAQASIEACVGDLISARNLARAEGVLRLSVSDRGRVTKVVAGEGDLGGTQLEDCLDAAARSWLFPPAEAEYAVDVPITVIRGGAPK